MPWKDTLMTSVTAAPVTAEADLRTRVSDFYSRQMRLPDNLHRNRRQRSGKTNSAQ